MRDMTRSWLPLELAVGIALPAVAVAGLLALAIPASAGAATQIGQTFTPTQTCVGVTSLQSVSPGSHYAAPFPGVITSWSFQADATFFPELKFKVARHTGGDNFMIVGEEGPHIPSPGSLNTYPTRISVQAGDVIGLTLGAGGTGPLCGGSISGYTAHKRNDDPAPGTTATYTTDSNLQLGVSARLEPDADNDGFGDETQDQCVGQGPTDACPGPPDPPSPDTASPSATITSGPKDKTRKKTATFEFGGTDTRAIASFQCSLDGEAPRACSSPVTYKVRKGKHHFEVQAIDQAGHVGAPATDDWKVKKKGKK
jgi:hypothetical protein